MTETEFKESCCDHQDNLDAETRALREKLVSHISDMNAAMGGRIEFKQPVTLDTTEGYYVDGVRLFFAGESGVPFISCQGKTESDWAIYPLAHFTIEQLLEIANAAVCVVLEQALKELEQGRAAGWI